MVAVLEHGKVIFVPDGNMMQALTQAASQLGGLALEATHNIGQNAAKAAAVTAVVGGGAAAVTGVSTTGLTIAGTAAMALGAAAVMEESKTPVDVIAHQISKDVPDEGITLRVSDNVAGGQHDAPAAISAPNIAPEPTKIAAPEIAAPEISTDAISAPVISASSEISAPAITPVPAHFASNETSKALAQSAMEGLETTDRQLDKTYQNYRDFMPLMAKMGIKLDDCEAGESTQHGCAVQNRPRDFDIRR